MAAEEIVIAEEADEDEDAIAAPAAPTDEGSDTTDGTPGLEYSVLPNPLYPDASVGTHAAPSPFENGFLQVAATLAEVNDHVTGAGLNANAFQQALQTTERLAASVSSRTERQAPPRSEVRQALLRADRLIPRLVLQGARAIVEGWASGRGFEIGDLSIEEAEPVEPAPAAAAAAADAEHTPEPVSLSEFEALRPLLLDDDQRGMLVTTDATENQVLVVLMPSPAAAAALQAAYEGAATGKKGQERRVQRLPIVEVRQAPPDTPVELPKEILTVTETDPNLGWAAWVTFWREPRTVERKVESKLAGWNVFHLHPTADNLADLKTLLDKVQYMAVSSEEDAT